MLKIKNIILIYKKKHFKKQTENKQKQAAITMLMLTCHQIIGISQLIIHLDE
jgi:hypothetical protein